MGLFGYTNGAALRNIGLLGGSVQGTTFVGGLVGFNNGGSISQAYATGDVSSSSSFSSGGLVGFNNGSISDAYATGDVSSSANLESYAGGLVGLNAGGSISQAYATGAVSASSSSSPSYAGGLVGANNTGSISQAYATGAVSASSSPSYTGGLVGANNTGSISDAYWNKDSTGQTTSAGGGTGLTTAEMFDQTNLQGFDFNTIWDNANNQTTPYLRNHIGLNAVLNKNSPSDGLYAVIQNIDQLQGINKNLSGKYVLGNNIDASATSGWNAGAGFAPIGNALTPFSGKFDGLGHTISNLNVNQPNIDYVGLFGYTNGAALRNIGLLGGSVQGGVYAGGLVGANNGSISNAYATGDVYSSTSFIISYAGGLVGGNTGSIINAYATGDVSSSAYSNTSTGGLVGLNTGGSISDAYWNKDSTGQTASAGGGTGLTSEQMLLASSFTGFDIDDQGGTGTVWRIYEGQTNPLLRSFLTSQNINAVGLCCTKI